MSVTLAAPSNPPAPALEKMRSDMASTGPAAPLNLVIRQDPFSITLDAAALVAVSVLLVLGMRYVDRTLLELGIVLVPIVLLVRNDYANFVRLGPGGTPTTPSGYARLKWYGLFALRDPFSPLPLQKRSPLPRPASGLLVSLPHRSGPRPRVVGLAPQRQLDQVGPPAVRDRLRRSVEAFVAGAGAGGRFVTATSYIEKHGFALFTRRPVTVFGNGEVWHIHSSEGSMHMNLHPDDIREVLLKGWGQRHPLAWTGWMHAPVPSTFCMVYAPRGKSGVAVFHTCTVGSADLLISKDPADESELRVICKIIEAAIWYTAAEKIELKPLVEPQIDTRI